MSTMEVNILTIPTSVFKVTCSKLFDTISKNREEYIVTRREVPIVRILPIGNVEDPFGLLKGTVSICGDILCETNANWKE